MAKKDTDQEKGKGILASLHGAVDSVKASARNVKCAVQSRVRFL